MMPCPWCVQPVSHGDHIPGALKAISSQVNTDYDREEARTVRLEVKWQCKNCGRYITTWTPMMEGI